MALEATKRLKLEALRRSALFLLTGETDYRVAALHGYVFEGLCHSILTRSSRPLKCRLRMLTPLSGLCDDSGNSVGLETYLFQHGFTNVESILKPATSKVTIGPFKQTRSTVARVLRRRPKTDYIPDEMTVEFPPLKLFQFEENEDVAAAINGQSTLWVPHSRRYEGVDALIPEHGVFCQMTRRESHKVSLKNINDFIGRNIFPRPTMSNSLLILFFVPAGTFANYKAPQEITNTGHQTQQGVGVWLHQAVVEIDAAKEYGVM